MRTLVTASLLALAALPAARQDTEALGAQLARGLQAALASPQLDRAARVERLAPLVEATHDVGAMAAALAAPTAEAWTPDQRALVEAGLRELVVASLAARIEAEGEDVKVVVGEAQATSASPSITLEVQPAGGRGERVEFTLAGDEKERRVIDLSFGSESLLGELRSALAVELAAAELAAGDAGAIAAALQVRARRYLMSPAEVVLELQRGLIEVMKQADELGFAGRYERLAPLVGDTHDLESAAKLVVSRKWKGLDTAQRTALTETFRELAIATYAARFDGFGGERFEGAEEEAARRSVIVKSRLVTGAGKEHRFDYLMRSDEGAWRIVNITVDGVSDLALKRQEYGNVIEQRGFPALIETLEAEVARYRAGGKD